MDVTYVGWGGRPRIQRADINLGFGTQRRIPSYGIRRALWDAAFGYVNGFPVRAIIYYSLTRSLNRRINVWALRREGIPNPERFSQSPMPFGTNV